MEERINLPPFYPSQKVVAMVSHHGITKDSQYTVYRIYKGCNCCWWVDVGVTYLGGTICNTCKVQSNDSTEWFGHKLFAPIESTFQSISFEKVIEKEKQMIGVN